MIIYCGAKYVKGAVTWIFVKRHDRLDNSPALVFGSRYKYVAIHQDIDTGSIQITLMDRDSNNKMLSKYDGDHINLENIIALITKAQKRIKKLPVPSRDLLLKFIKSIT